MIPDWLLNITQAVFEWHGSLPDWLALVVGILQERWAHLPGIKWFAK